jgi:hypothetical protein
MLWCWTSSAVAGSCILVSIALKRKVREELDGGFAVSKYGPTFEESLLKPYSSYLTEMPETSSERSCLAKAKVLRVVFAMLTEGLCLVVAGWVVWFNLAVKLLSLYASNFWIAFEWSQLRFLPKTRSILASRCFFSRSLPIFSIFSYSISACVFSTLYISIASAFTHASACFLL